jgi:hypothetical protein
VRRSEGEDTIRAIQSSSPNPERLKKRL